MKSQLPRLLTGFVIVAVPWLSAATRAAPAASRSLDECIAAMADPNWAIAGQGLDDIQTVAKAFPLSDEQLGRLLNLAEGRTLSASRLHALATAMERASAGASDPSAAALAHDQLVFIRAVGDRSSLFAAQAEMKSPELRASASLATVDLGEVDIRKWSEVRADGVAGRRMAPKTLLQCVANDVQEIWTRDSGASPHHWRRQPISAVLRAHQADWRDSPSTLFRAVVLAAAGKRARAAVLLARVREDDPFLGEPRYDAADRQLATSLYLKWNGTTLSFRFLRWLAGHMPGSGWLRLCLGMTVVAICFHLLQLPILLKARRSFRERTPTALWLAAGVTFTQWLPVMWTIVVGPAWVFAFDEDRPWFGESVMIVVAVLGAVPLGILTATPIALLMAQIATMNENQKWFGVALRRNAGSIAGTLVPSLMAGALLIIRHNDLLNGIGVDVAAFMLATGPVPLAIYVGLLLRRRRMAGTT